MQPCFFFLLRVLVLFGRITFAAGTSLGRASSRAWRGPSGLDARSPGRSPLDCTWVTFGLVCKSLGYLWIGEDVHVESELERLVLEASIVLLETGVIMKCDVILVHSSTSPRCHLHSHGRLEDTHCLYSHCNEELCVSSVSLGVRGG